MFPAASYNPSKQHDLGRLYEMAKVLDATQEVPCSQFEPCFPYDPAAPAASCSQEHRDSALQAAVARALQEGGKEIQVDSSANFSRVTQAVKDGIRLVKDIRRDGLHNQALSAAMGNMSPDYLVRFESECWMTICRMISEGLDTSSDDVCRYMGHMESKSSQLSILIRLLPVVFPSRYFYCVTDRKDHIIPVQFLFELAKQKMQLEEQQKKEPH
eukprot:TRINITY_DN5035_c0_g3_i3.p1 TRINITY_DN5035_c0_g3~~TRINITY_DN5035_c0_g3_i3.p1  ORF type:complete len:214 (+),score=23.34 TRINITY_DN5035_c0_g3_i3:100-741(+)